MHDTSDGQVADSDTPAADTSGGTMTGDEMNAAGGAYGTTSGSDDREARPLMERLMVLDLAAEVSRLRAEEQWATGDRNSRTLAKEVDFRVLLTVLRDGATLTEEDGDARVSIQLLEGAARLDATGMPAELAAGHLAVIETGEQWRITAAGDCALLLTLAWPRSKATGAA